MELKMFLNSKGRYQGGGKRPRLDDYVMSDVVLKARRRRRSDRNEGDDNNDSGDDDDDARCTD